MDLSSIPITQAEQRQLKELEEQKKEASRLLAVAKAKHQAKSDELTRRNMAGAEIKLGVYKPTFERRKRRVIRYKQVVIDLKGKEFQQKAMDDSRWSRTIEYYVSHVS